MLDRFESDYEAAVQMLASAVQDSDRAEEAKGRRTAVVRGITAETTDFAELIKWQDRARARLPEVDRLLLCATPADVANADVALREIVAAFDDLRASSQRDLDAIADEFQSLCKKHEALLTNLGQRYGQLKQAQESAPSDYRLRTEQRELRARALDAYRYSAALGQPDPRQVHQGLRKVLAEAPASESGERSPELWSPLLALAQRAETARRHHVELLEPDPTASSVVLRRLAELNKSPLPDTSRHAVVSSASRVLWGAIATVAAIAIIAVVAPRWNGLIRSALLFAVDRSSSGASQAGDTGTNIGGSDPVAVSPPNVDVLQWLTPSAVVGRWDAQIGIGDGPLTPGGTFTILSDGIELGGTASGRWQFWKVAQYGLYRAQSDDVFQISLDSQLSGAPAVTVAVPSRASDIHAAFARAYRSWSSSRVGQQQLAKVSRSRVQPTESRVETPTPPMVPTPLPSTVFEAEAAELAGSAKQSREHLGYSGSGYVDGFGLNGLGATTTFRVTVAEAGGYEVSLRYANATGRVMTLTIHVNGPSVGRTAMAPLPTWNTWGDKSEVVQLVQGANTIAYRYDQGDTGNVNLDYIRIEPASSQPVPAPTPALRPAESPETQSAVPRELTVTVLHRHGAGGLSGALVRHLLNGKNATGGPNYCKGDVTITADGLSFKTMVTSDSRRDDVHFSYTDIKKVKRQEPEHLRVETDKHGRWDFFADSSVIEQIERSLLTRSDLFKR